MTSEEIVDRIEKAMIVMQEIIVRHDERIDTFDADLKRSRKNFEFKMNALIDAQIKNKTAIEKLRAASEQT